MTMKTLDQIIKEYVNHALGVLKGNVTHVAKALGISVKTVRKYRQE